jgi:hypothetical protein
MKAVIIPCLSLVPFGLLGQTPAQNLMIAKEVLRARDAIRQMTIEFEGNVALSRYNREVTAWEKGKADTLVRVYRYSSIHPGKPLWYEARLSPGMAKPSVSLEPFFIDSYQNRDYQWFFNKGPLKNGLVIKAGCVFQAWASNIRPVGNFPTQYYNATGNWDAVLAYQATSKIQSNTPPHENGEKTVGPTQDEYRRVPFRAAGATFFTLPGQNRHFGSIMNLLSYDPLLVPNPAKFGWTDGVDQYVRVVPDPSLKESPLPPESSPRVPSPTTNGTANL